MDTASDLPGYPGHKYAMLALPDDLALRRTIDVYQEVLNEACQLLFGHPTPIAWTTQKEMYHQLKGRVNAGMTQTAIRTACSRYYWSKDYPSEPIAYTQPQAQYRIFSNQADASFLGDRLSLWSVEGRRRLPFNIIEGRLEGNPVRLLLTSSDNGLLARVRLRIRRDQRRAPEAKRYDALRRRYGLQPTDYERLLSTQDGCCAICRQPPDTTSRRTQHLRVDHNHANGTVRGLLCDLCNRYVGFIEKYPDRFHAMLEYIATRP